MSNYSFLNEKEQQVYAALAADIKRVWDNADLTALERLRAWWQANPASGAGYIRQILADYPKYLPSRSPNKRLRHILRQALAAARNPLLLAQDLAADPAPAAPTVNADALPIAVSHVKIDPYIARPKTAIFLHHKPVYGLPPHNAFALR